MLATVFVLVPLRLNSKSIKIPASLALLAGLYCVTSYKVNTHELELHLEKRVQHYNRGQYWVWPYPVAETNAIVAEAVSLGIYEPPPRPLPKPTFFYTNK
jgi:hypothetical protein